jgi:hypothetical protein
MKTQNRDHSKYIIKIWIFIIFLSVGEVSTNPRRKKVQKKCKQKKKPTIGTLGIPNNMGWFFG